MLDRLLLALPTGAIISFLFGHDTATLSILKILLFVSLVDFIGGIIKSIYDKNFSRKVFWKGFSKKIGQIALVALAYQIDKTGLFKEVINLQLASIYSYIIYEVLSILHIFRTLGIFVPKDFNILKKERR